MPWSKFLQAYWDVIAAADFFTVEVWTAVGLVRYLVFFVLDLSTRRVEIAGIAPAPHGLWMSQVARNLVDECERSHQGLGNRLIDARGQLDSGPVVCQERLGGLLNHYRRLAA